ncbi:NADH dehydrogenase [ubiquinone] flavoprotein 3, mitochondrial isoform X1 [Manis pentadactyla]|uniref:NADH dehydrogenase [ubiquinone] flavoprotein 3, mitochondrial isoform X1 n=2 Tax=Manis pentadactyla TaxID=143292 RepID=UPI00255CC770|nr:NADH dehydrogenase [ubiquinone] flavoprotein 3, mitochondrial isoform X1 [Manis pentadactyla]KAI5182097.1 Nadh Dehydrogenase [Ubiquinone] Flavoprotein 3 [Manis pentadactyla]
MAAAVLLRQGRAGTLKTLVLEARVFRGLAPTVSFSAESGKSGKGLPLNPKSQNSSKNVVEPKERGKLLATPTAAELSKNLPSPSSNLSVVNPGGKVAGPDPDGSVLFADEGVPKFMSRKTLVEFPQKVPSPFRKQGSDSEAPLQSRSGPGDSSSSSSSGSSDSESDEEGGGSGVRGKGGPPKPEASQSFKNAASGKGKTWSQQPQPDLTSSERPRQAKKKGTTIKPSEDGTGAKPKTPTPKSQVGQELMRQNVKGKQLQKLFRAHDVDKESQKPFKKTLPSHAKPGLSTQPTGGPRPSQLPEETKQAAPSETTERLREKRELVPGTEVAFSLPRKENSKAFPDDRPTAPAPEGQGGTIEDAAAQAEGQDTTQEPTQATTPAGTFDNTTYRNLQHHDYSTYTFLDLNLDLTKFRMPQPSSGRESPRH